MTIAISTAFDWPSTALTCGFQRQIWCRRGDLNPCRDPSTPSTWCVSARQRPRRPSTPSVESTDSRWSVCFRDHSVTNIHRRLEAGASSSGLPWAIAVNSAKIVASCHEVPRPPSALFQLTAQPPSSQSLGPRPALMEVVPQREGGSSESMTASAPRPCGSVRCRATCLLSSVGSTSRSHRPTDKPRHG